MQFKDKDIFSFLNIARKKKEYLKFLPSSGQHGNFMKALFSWLQPQRIAHLICSYWHSLGGRCLQIACWEEGLGEEGRSMMLLFPINNLI